MFGTRLRWHAAVTRTESWWFERLFGDASNGTMTDDGRRRPVMLDVPQRVPFFPRVAPMLFHPLVST